MHQLIRAEAGNAAERLVDVDRPGSVREDDDLVEVTLRPDQGLVQAGLLLELVLGLFPGCDVLDLVDQILNPAIVPDDG